MFIFGDTLNQLLKRQRGDQVRLGAGVVGHTSYVTIAAIVVIGIVALMLAQNTAVCIDAILGVVAIAGYYLHGTWKFADKYPDAAAIGGTAWPQPPAPVPVKPVVVAQPAVKPAPVVRPASAPVPPATPAPPKPATAATTATPASQKPLITPPPTTTH